VEEDQDEISTDQIEVTSERFDTRWKPVDIGAQIQVDFSEDNFVITDAVILNNSGDLTRLSALEARPDRPQVRGFFATGSDGFEILVQLDEISDVI